MTTKEKQLYGDIDDLLLFAGGYLTALRQASGNDKLVKRTEKVIAQIGKRYAKPITKLYEAPAKHPDSICFKGG